MFERSRMSKNQSSTPRTTLNTTNSHILHVLAEQFVVSKNDVYFSPWSMLIIQFKSEKAIDIMSSSPGQSIRMAQSDPR